jgi:hypothetical protein
MADSLRATKHIYTAYRWEVLYGHEVEALFALQFGSGSSVRHAEAIHMGLL